MIRIKNYWSIVIYRKLGSPNIVGKHGEDRGGQFADLVLKICICKNRILWDIEANNTKRSLKGTVDEKDGIEEQLWYFELKFGSAWLSFQCLVKSDVPRIHRNEFVWSLASSWQRPKLILPRETNWKRPEIEFNIFPRASTGNASN